MKTKFNENGIMVLDFEGKNITLSGDAYYKYLSTASEPDNWVCVDAIDDDGNDYNVYYHADPEEIKELDEIDYSEPDIIYDCESGRDIYYSED